MKTSHRKYNNQYRDSRWKIDGAGNPEIVPECNEHKRCDVCRCHVKEGAQDLVLNEEGHAVMIQEYTCPTCGKTYGVQYDITNCTDEPWATITSLLKGGEAR